MTTAKKTFDPWPAATVTAVADILADTSEGLSGREIGLLLAGMGIADADGPNRRERLARALLLRQDRDRASTVWSGSSPKRWRPCATPGSPGCSPGAATTSGHLHAWCFDHGRAHVFAAGTTPWCSAAWVGFVAASADQALEAKQAAYGDAQYFNQLSAVHQLEVIEVRAARAEKLAEPEI
ncbi:hypothetical protein [Streptomyces halstedii]|uniref:Uncharacterized protein n=1 Tax=Streptomyces halstedii TaxID=1944 RepID=A0A6N9UDI8_STRHA|nr:hypothetical protein [Streptomyces halstedii]NEA20652.1 hypothetical protein [Streptomyces halstedii]